MEDKEYKASEIVVALADMASKGRYDNVTPQGARNMNNLFELVAMLINDLEKAEKFDEQALELQKQFMAEQALQDEELENDDNG